MNAEELFPKVRLVVLGGEEVVKRDIELHRIHFTKESTFVNGLGPTESTLALQYCIDSETRIVRHSVPVGYPVEETEILLLNENGEDAVVYGEIAIRSAYLASGYWKKPELTSKAFLPDPDGYDRRIYRTGDMGRLLPNGSLQFAGRKDFQVKLRGFRIELEEIETVLTGHPVTRQAVLMIRENSSGEKGLVAYVVPEQGQTATVNGLRSFLKQKLPHYMVPSHFVFLDNLPLTPTGKVNRRALPALDSEGSNLGGALDSPRTPAEELLVGIWCQLLEQSQIGVQDNFFDLGGHSLLATRVMSRIRESFQVELPLRTLFEAPTVAGLAEVIGIVQQGEQPRSALPIRPVQREGPLPLSFAQRRLWFLNQLEPGSSAYNISVAIHLKGDLKKAAFESSFGEVLRRHEVLRTTFVTENNEPIQLVTAPRTFALPLEDLTTVPQAQRGAKAESLAREEATRSFDLAAGPLFRAQLLKLSSRDHLLLLTLHHIVADGWSMGTLFKELSVFYEGFSTGRLAELPELPVQYADYTLWQREWLGKEELDRQLVLLC